MSANIDIHSLFNGYNCTADYHNVDKYLASLLLIDIFGGFQYYAFKKQLCTENPWNNYLLNTYYVSRIIPNTLNTVANLIDKTTLWHR